MENSQNNSITLYVDLDGTFIKSDMLLESFIAVLKNNPFLIFLCFYWLLKGRAFLKFKLSQRAEIALELLPLNNEFYTFLLDEKSRGRKIILATASSEKFAKGICHHYDFFDSYISSNKDLNLKGETKLKEIKKISDKFAYAGNSSEDFILFEKADESYLVNPTNKAKSMSLNSSFTATFDDGQESKYTWLKQLRVHQWLKNFLIFVPFLVSGEFLNVNSFVLSLLSFISFCCLASATYILNDLHDLDADRSHDHKKFRPLAAGNINILNAIIISLLLLIVSFSIAYNLGGMFIYVLLSYLIITLFYSFKLKQLIGLDVITLATLYTIRIFAGAVILSITLSFWLLSFSMFVFFSLALVKRCAELKSKELQENKDIKGRDYNTTDYNVLMNLGISSAMLSILMFCFYTNSNILSNQYQEPTILWLIVPALSYWLMRMWVKTNRGEMHDDPIVFSIKDKGSLMTIGFIVIIALLAQVL